jgi:hypothetical protein
MGAQAGRSLTRLTYRGNPRNPRSLAFAALASALLLATLPGTLAAQDPPPLPPPDTLPADTPVVVPVDTPSVAPADTLPPSPLVRVPGTRIVGAHAGVWRWDRAALLTETGLSIADLLDRVPGVDVLRGGTFLQPEAALAFGGTSDRIEIVWDGFLLDPLSASALDLSKIRLVQLAEVVVERRLDLLRLHLRTEESEAREPYSRVEAALGQPTMNVFRGLILAPHFLFGPIAAGVDRLEADGRRGREPVDVLETWAKWGWTSPDYGVQAELRRYTLKRRPESPWPLQEERQDLVLRGRASPVEGLVAEAYFGRSSLDWRRFGQNDTIPDATRATDQLGARALLAHGPIAARAALRSRSHESLPRLQADVGGTAALGAIVDIDAELTHTSWRDGSSALATRAFVAAAPFAGARVFAELTGGARAAPFFPHGSEPGDEDEDAPGPPPVLRSERSGRRAGVSVERWGLSGGVAALRVETDSVPAFRMPFDSAATLLPGGDASGVEAWARVPIPRTAFALEGAVVDWSGGTGWAYLPRRQWRAALVFDADPLESGNLHIVGRAEAYHRGTLFAPTAAGNDSEVMAASTNFRGSLSIRIIDVHIFGRIEDLGDRATADLPGLQPPGPRFYYGVKWNFWN